jgi:putative ABC transport system permease protein
VLSILMALVSLVLLVACTNVTGVLIARADARRHEMAVRLSIGAGRARLVRQLLVETLLLFGIGALAGIATARGMMRGLVAALPALPVPLSIDVPLDLRVFAFTIGLAAMAAIASGLVPALRASRAHPASALKAESGGTSSRWRLRSAFVVGQASISVALVFTAVVFTRALVFAVSTDPGYDSRDVEIVTIDLSARGETPEASLPFWRSLIERVRQLPGLESASLARALPGGFETMGIAVAPPDRAASQEPGSFEPDGNIVAPGYFKTMGIPLLAGRDFTSADVAGAAPVTIVGEAAARHYWPGRTAVGQYLEETTPQGRRLRLVVGVVRDVRSSTLIDGVAQSVVYLPLEQERSGLISTMTVVARASGTRPVAADVRAAVASLNPNLPIVTTDTLRDSIALGLIPQRVVALATASLGLASAILAAIGIYGVSSFAVSRRTREFGIRMALGASRKSILRMVLGQGVLLALGGTAIGIGLGAGAVKALTSFLFGIPALDPVVVGATIAVFTAVAGVACYGPARRAINVDPLAALRRE